MLIHLDQDEVTLIISGLGYAIADHDPEDKPVYLNMLNLVNKLNFCRDQEQQTGTQTPAYSPWLRLPHMVAQSPERFWCLMQDVADAHLSAGGEHGKAIEKGR